MNSFVNFLNYTLFFNRKERRLFYTVMASQLRAGRSEGAAALTIANDLKLTPNITRVARIGAQKEIEGEGLIEGLASSAYFPPDEIGVLRVAYAKGVIKQACEDLIAAVSTRPSLMANAVLPASYLLFFCGLFLVLAYNGQEFFYSLEDDAAIVFADNIAFKTTAHMNTFGSWYLAASIAIVLMVKHGRSSLPKHQRFLLGFLDKDYRLLFTIEFANLAVMMYRQGASHQEVLAVARTAIGSAKYKNKSLGQALQSHLSGAQFEDALVEHGVLYEAHAKLIKAISASGNEQSYAAAFQSLEEIAIESVKARYAYFQFSLQLFAALFIVTSIGIFMSGMFSMLTT